MGFVKVIKNKAYYMRYQVKYKRRRQAKTDYYARSRLIVQDRNKYKTPKYRFVVRFSNRDITCQIISADLDHDVVIASAYAHELRRYGITVGLTNYAAAYCTGLLLARRINSKFNLDYEGQVEVDGEDYDVTADDDGERSPFRAFLDVGLKPTTSGSRLWGALKGACDGGIDIPHKTRRFPGSSKQDREIMDDPDKHREYIFGQHVANYMTALESDDPDAYRKQFSAYIRAGVSGGDLEGLYEKAHAAIRANPNIPRDDKELGNTKTRSGAKTAPVKKRWNRAKTSVQQKKNRIRQILSNKGIEANPVTNWSHV